MLQDDPLLTLAKVLEKIAVEDGDFVDLCAVQRLGLDRAALVTFRATIMLSRSGLFFGQCETRDLT